MIQCRVITLDRGYESEQCPPLAVAPAHHGHGRVQHEGGVLPGQQSLHPIVLLTQLLLSRFLQDCNLVN